MSKEKVEAEALKLDPKARERLWAEEAERRNAEWDARTRAGRSAASVLLDARAKLK
jgi:hypothetical protein